MRTILFLLLSSTIPGIAAAATPAWPPALVVGVSVPAFAAPGSAASQGPTPWCDFGAHAQALVGTPVQQDPVFRAPSDAAKAQLGVVRKSLLGGAKDAAALAAAEGELARLLAGPDGPALARLAMRDDDPTVRAAGLRAAKALIPPHLRLASFAVPSLQHADAAVTEAAVRLMFATGCDTPALFALDGLKHPSPAVQLATLQELARALPGRTDLGIVGKVLAHVEAGGGAPVARVVAVRLAGQLGWQPATLTLEKLTRSAEPALAAEALWALAVVGPGRAERLLADFGRAREPVRRAGAARAAAEVFALRGEEAARFLQPLAQDAGRFDDVAAPGTRAASLTVGEVAQRALRHVRLDP